MNVFEEHRSWLLGLAYRMLGSLTDAEDIIQDAYVRWSEAGEPRLKHPRAWLAKTCTRLCIDKLKSARHEREQYIGEWLPEPILPLPNSAEQEEVDDSLSMALLHMMERLPPAERAAFLLHDIFNYSFKEVADILDKETANCRQLASRARKHLKRTDDADQMKKQASKDQVQKMSAAFFQAIKQGDVQGLKQLLAHEVVLYADGGGKVTAAGKPVCGADLVSTFFMNVLSDIDSNIYSIDWREFNGSPGCLVKEHGCVVSAFQFSVQNDLIVGIFVVRNPDKLEPLIGRA